MSAAQYVRAFVAIELNDELRSVLAESEARLKKAPVSYIGRWVAPASVHLTLKFLGDVTPNRLDAVTRALGPACSAVSTFAIALSGLGCFPNRRRPRVIWIGVTGDFGPLQELQRRIESALEPLGFSSERRPFQPHLTLARIRDRASASEREEMMRRVEATTVPPSPRMIVRDVELIRSELRPTGAVYTQLAAFPLAEEGAP